MNSRLNVTRIASSSIVYFALMAATAGTLSAQAPAPVAAPAAPAQTPPVAAAPVQGTSTLTIKIKGIRNAKGKIDVVLYGSDKGFPMDPSSAVAVKQVDVDPATMTATIVFDKLSQGAYAATVMHDENLVGKMEFDAQGIPIEGYGISNNPDSNSGPPTWDASKFSVGQVDTAIEIAMVYWK